MTKTLLRLALISLLLCGVCSSQVANANTLKAATSKGTPRKRVATPSSEAAEDEIKQLKEALAAFQQKTEQQLQSLQEQNASLTEQLRQYQQKTDAVQTDALQSQQKVAILEEQKPAVARLQAEMTAVKTAVTATAKVVQQSDKRLGELESPPEIRFRGIKLTPGGYMQFGQIYRTHNANADSADAYGSFPLSGSPNSMTSEYRISARASRFSLKGEGNFKKMKMMGYVEVDFLGTSPNATQAQFNSFPPRLRLAFGEMKFGKGWTVAGGQMSSMLQTTRQGIDSLSEWLPSVLDGNLTTGYSYARQGALRVVKELVPNRQWLGFSMENPETVANVQCLFIPTDTSIARSSCTGLILGGAIQGTENTPLTGSPSSGFSLAAGTSGNLLSSPSNNIAPDLVLKYAIEPGWGHYEVKAIGRVFHDRVYPQFLNGSSLSGANNRSTEGGGFGVGAILPVLAKKMDVNLQAIAGKGIGRFGPAGGPDVTVNPKGDLVPVKALQAIVGVETHLTPRFDLNFYLGDEYYGRATYSTNTGLFGSTTPGVSVIGYGAPQFVDDACTENSTAIPSLCMSSSQNRNVWTAQPQLWYRLYRGNRGTLQLGASYAYTYRRTWDGLFSNSNSGNIPSFRPLAIENVVMTAFRYTLP
jgi:TolA-binding protein